MLTASGIVRKGSMAPEPGEDYPDPTRDGYTYDEDPSINPSNNVDASQLAASSGFDESNWLQYAIDKANSGDSAWQDKLWNYLSTREGEKTARDWTAQREDNAYQRLMADFKAAGLSPYILSGASPMASASGSKAFSGSELTSSKNNKENNQTRSLIAQLGFFGIILSALFRAGASIASNQ